MSIRMSGPSEQMGLVRLEDLSSWSLENRPTEEIKDLLRSMQPGSVVLDASEFHLSYAPGSSTFVQKDEMAEGRGDSQHGVRFGQMILNSAYHHEKPELVAVKPFERARDLYFEWAASKYANSFGEHQRAYLPLGIWRDKDAMFNLLTVYDHGVKTYDSVFWADMETSPEAALRPEVIENAFVLYLRGIGLMHGIGISHGDSRVKNLGSDFRRVRFVDLESTYLLEREGSEVVMSKDNDDKTRRDIDMFMDSCFMVPGNDAVVGEYFENNPYALKKGYDAYMTGLEHSQDSSGFRLSQKLAVIDPEYFEKALDLQRRG